MTEMASARAEPDVGGETGPATDTRTLPRLLADRARRHPDRVALQEKRYGIWQPLTWGQCHERVRDFAHGLASLGVGRGHAVAVIGDNRPEWLIAELAAQSLGAAVVGVEPTHSGEQVATILDLAEVRVVVVQGQEQVDQLIDRPRAVVVYYDPHGLEQYTEPNLHEFAAVERAGRAWGGHRPGWLDARLADIGPDDVATLATTSDERLELAELTHHGMLAAADRLTGVDPIAAADRYVCFLPLASTTEQLLGVACGLTRGRCLSFPEQATTQRGDLREIGPGVIYAPPRLWESMVAEVRVRLAEAGWLKRTVFGWAYGVGERVALLRARGRRPGVRTRLAHMLAHWTALRPVRDHLGLLRARQCYTGGVPLGPEVFGFFRAIGVNLKQTYGRAEAGGVVTVHRDGDVAFGTVGAPLRGVDVELSERGEILLRGACLLRGYRRPGATSEQAVDAQGWFHTGDIGQFDDSGHLVVLGRPPDVVQACDGRRFGKPHIESALRCSPYIADAVIVGEPEPAGVSAIVTIDVRSVGAWAERRKLPHTGDADLAGQRGVGELIAEEIGRTNRDLPESVQVHRFALLPRQLEPDDEITPTGEVRREVVAVRWADLIDETARQPSATAADRRPVWRR